MIDLADDPLGAGEAAFGTAALVDAEHEARFDRRGLGAHVVAVERQARLQPQRIPRAKANGLHFGLGAEQVGDFGCGLGGERDFEPVLAGIARPRDGDIMAGQLELAELHEGQRREGIFAGRMARQSLGRLGALQGQQRAVIEVVDGDVIGQRLAQRAEIVPLGRTIDDKVKRIRPARDHQVIEHPAAFVEQQRIALLAKLERRKVNRQHRFDRRVEIGAGQQQLAHVRYVEQACILARPIVFGDNALVLNGHLIARERHHPRTPRAVPRIERQRVQRQVFEEFVGIVVGHLRKSPAEYGSPAAHAALPNNCPLCRVT